LINLIKLLLEDAKHMEKWSIFIQILLQKLYSWQ